MFEEIEQLLADLRKKIESLGPAVAYAGDYFRALALAECYNKLIEFADHRTQQHPEVQRVPALRTVLLAHLISNADRHIDVRTERVFNPLLLGSPKSLREWQESGWRTKRSAANYRRRLKYWEALYDEAPIIHQERVRSGTDIFSERGAIYRRGKNVEKRVKNLTGDITKEKVTYEQVIAARNTNYSATSELVPWWEALNYGTAFTGIAGYPNVAGLHFVEDAEKLVPSTIRKYFNLFDAYVDHAFSAEIKNPIYDIERWVNANMRLSGDEYVPLTELARIKTFGVPF